MITHDRSALPKEVNMTDPTDVQYEFITRAVKPDGTLIDESKPRDRLASWAAGVGTEILSLRHPDLIVAQLRRPAGSDGRWEVVKVHAGDVAAVPAICEPSVRREAAKITTDRSALPTTKD